MNEPLKVLHCAAGNLYGGVESFLRTLADCRGEAPGLAQEFAVCFEGRLSSELDARGAVVHRLGGVKFSQPWTVWRARRRLGRVLALGGADVLVGHGCWAHLLAAPAARRAGRGVAFYAHDRLGGGHWVEPAAGRVPPDVVVANSRGTAETLPLVFPGVPAVVVHPLSPPAARPGTRAGTRAGLATPGDDVVILTACRLERWKGQALLIEALGRLRGTPGWTAWVAGGAQRPHEHAYLDELRAAAGAQGVADRVRFLGQRDDMPCLLEAADIHCQPNTGPEPFGIAFVEALGAGLPVVSTRLGGASEIVTDACGVLVPPGDASALADALARLVADPDARARLAAAGPARAAALCAPALVLPALEAALRRARSRQGGRVGSSP